MLKEGFNVCLRQPRGGQGGSRATFFFVGHSKRTRGNKYNLQQGKF